MNGAMHSSLGDRLRGSARRTVATIGLGIALVLVMLPLGAHAGPSARAAVTLPSPVACNNSVGNCWKPAVKARWQYQLQGSPNPKGGCLYGKTGFVNIGVTGTSFATGRTVAGSATRRRTTRC